MEKLPRFPYQFFLVTFAWSWLIWLPLVLASAGILPLDKDTLSVLTVPVTMVGVFGPAVGAFYCLKTLHGKDSIRRYMRGLLDLRLGCRAWLIPIILLGGSTWIAWRLPELWGEPRVQMLLPSVWVFPPYVLFMILLGGGQEKLGWRGYIMDPLEARLGPWLGNLVLGVIHAFWHLPLFLIQDPGTEPDVHALCRFCLADNGVCLVLRLGAPRFWKPDLGRFDYSRLGKCFYPPVSYSGYGFGGRTAPLLDVGKLDLCDWFDNNGHQVTKDKNK